MNVISFADNGCSSSFWKRSEPLFNVRPEDKSFLEEQVCRLQFKLYVFSGIPISVCLEFQISFV